MVIETDADEANYGNNEKDVSVHAKCVISLSSGNGGTVRGTGSYSYGSTVTISAIPNEGYICLKVGMKMEGASIIFLMSTPSLPSRTAQ